MDRQHPGPIDKEPVETHDAWWAIHASVIQQMMRRAADGENPDLLYVELIANSRSERSKDNDNE